MYGLMNNHDLNMYYSGTFMRNENRIVYVESIRGDGTSAVAQTNRGEIPIEDLSVFFPDTCAVQYEGRAPLLIHNTSSRNYKKSYRDGRGGPNTFCEALTATLNGELPSFSEAVEQLSSMDTGHRVFGISGRFYLRKMREFSVLTVHHMNDFLGYYNASERCIVVPQEVDSILVQRLVKNSGGVNVTVEQ